MKKIIFLLLFIFLIQNIYSGGTDDSLPFLTKFRELVHISYFLEEQTGLSSGEGIIPISWLNNGLFAYIKVNYRKNDSYFAEVSYSTVIFDLKANRRIWSTEWSEFVNERLPEGNIDSYYNGQWKKALPIIEKYNVDNVQSDSKVNSALNKNVRSLIIPNFIYSQELYNIDKKNENNLYIGNDARFSIVYKNQLKEGLWTIYLDDKVNRSKTLLVTTPNTPLSYDNTIKPVRGYFYNHYEDSYIFLVGNYDEDFIQVKIEKEPTKASKKNYYTPTINNLRFRATPTLDGRFIRHLKAGEKLELIERGKSETIGEVKGTWVKVKTGQGEVGWCFDAYLEEVK